MLAQWRTFFARDSNRYHHCEVSRILTFSNMISSPIVGAQYPSITTTSPDVTLYCRPHRWITANKRPSSCCCTKLLTLLTTSLQVLRSTVGVFKNSISVFWFWNERIGKSAEPILIHQRRYTTMRLGTISLIYVSLLKFELLTWLRDLWNGAKLPSDIEKTP